MKSDRRHYWTFFTTKSPSILEMSNISCISQEDSRLFIWSIKWEIHSSVWMMKSVCMSEKPPAIHRKFQTRQNTMQVTESFTKPCQWEAASLRLRLENKWSTCCFSFVPQKILLSVTAYLTRHRERDLLAVNHLRLVFTYRKRKYACCLTLWDPILLNHCVI